MLNKIHNEVKSFFETLQASKDLRLVIDSQEISKSEKKNTLEELLQDRVSHIFMNFLFLLLRKNREALISTIVQELDILVDRHNRKIRASTITAVPLDSQTLTSLKDLLDETYRADVSIDSRTDSSILGGIIVKVDGRVFDGSLQSQLRRLRARLAEDTNSH